MAIWVTKIIPKKLPMFQNKDKDLAAGYLITNLSKKEIILWFFT